MRGALSPRMVFDSVPALVLFAACIAAWTLVARARTAARVNTRFAALLFAALAVARLVSLSLPDFSNLAPAVAMMAASLGTTALTLGLCAVLSRAVPPLAATLALARALGAGLAASLSGLAAYAFGCQILAVLLTLAAALGGFAMRRRISVLAMLAATALLCGGLCLMDNALTPALLFFAGALISAARASQPFVEAQRKAQRLGRVAARG
jgi:hypothetical protein